MSTAGLMSLEAERTNCSMVRYLISQGLLLDPGLFLGLLKSQTHLLLGLCVSAQGCFFGLAGSAGIRLVKFCQLPDNRDTETGPQQHDPITALYFSIVDLK